jgi:D-alanyl-D-alanine carboxypeptidase
VKTITVKAGTVTSSVLVPFVANQPQATVAPQEFAATEQRNEALPPPSRPGILGTLVTPANAAEAPQQQETTYDVASETSRPAPPPATPRAIARGAWIIQVGAFPEEEKAKERIREAQTVGKRILANANPFTEKVVKGRTELYRARFAGFDQDAAEAACKLFKRNEIACVAMKN